MKNWAMRLKDEEIHETGIGCAQQNTGHHLNGCVSHKLLQFFGGKILFGQYIDRFDQFIDCLSLFAGFPADAHSVMADDDGQNGADGKLERTGAAGKCRVDGKGCDCCRVAAGHTAVAEQTLQIPAFADNGVDDHFQHLCNEPGGDAGDEKRIANQIKKPVQKTSPFS